MEKSESQQIDVISKGNADLDLAGPGEPEKSPELTIPTYTNPLQDHQQEQFVSDFSRVGCVVVTGVLSPAEVVTLREKTDECTANPATPAKHISYAGTTLVLRRCHEMDPLFEAMTTRKEIREIVETVLGPDARFNALNVIRNERDQAISYWHVDDVVEFPLPLSISRFDARMRMPIFWMTVQVALTDIESVEHGATQFIPGSHYSGRNPEPGENPRFEGKGPIAVLCKAGDIYLTNHQCWHRGAPNQSDRTRYLMQLQFAQRWADARFKGLA